MKLRLLLTCAAVIGLTGASFAQSRAGASRRSNDDWCSQSSNGRRAHHCEVRESTVSGLNPLDIDAGTNGGIQIEGWDRSDVHVRARIDAYGDTEAAARSLASQVRIDASGASVRADGPSSGRDEGWSVSFDIQVPRTAMLTLHTHNGGIAIEDFRGTANVHALNGGVSLRNVSGDIRGGTTNGGITVSLSGAHWDGAGLDVETTNGGVRIDVPAHYSATLETATVNGRIRVDFPITVTGSLGKRLTTTLGSGGATIRATTTNGGVSIRRQ
jgi:DUF4097 and DUF4098 domain-containing protein YvlB